jgi:quercetin dioxygenase-like cupin family protein
MLDIFPDFIKKLPKLSINLEGCEAYLLQSKKQQVIFMKFNKDVELPEHTHESQWEIVLEGEVIVWINDDKKKYRKGDRFYIPSKTLHKAQIFKDYTSIVIFNQKDRYKIK